MNIGELFGADVRIVRDVTYGDGTDNPAGVLDIYAPPEAANSPVIVFFFGGGWRSGNKRLFEHLGRAFAVRNIVAVTVNYRLTPQVRHPSHVRDCAAAVAWTHGNIRMHGGDPRRIVLMGHSAGAHLAALLSADRRYLDEHDVPRGDIRGVVCLSGVYDLRDHARSSAFTTSGHVEEAFGSGPSELGDASPLLHVGSGIPPTLVIVAEHDPQSLHHQAKIYSAALRSAGNSARLVVIRGRDHHSSVRRFGLNGDTTVNAAAEFANHVTLDGN